MCMGLGVWNGCQTFQGTKFAPLEARLEIADYSGARTLVLVNTNGQALHNVQFEVYVWDRNQNQMIESHQPYQLMSSNGQLEQIPSLTCSFAGSDAKLDAGEVIHFMGNGTIGESRILDSVIKVQITGTCNEGAFRETWLMGGNGQLELVGVP